MIRKMIRKDIAGNRMVSITITLFIAAAAMLLSLTGILVTNLAGSIDQLMKDAKTPHFMQMHSGGADMGQLEDFAEDNSRVEAFQVLEFLNVDNDSIIIDGHSFSGNVQDNGFSTQSSEFDYLLDLDNKPVYPEDGELYVPVCYYKDQTAEVGDMAVIGGKSFVVAGFVRDSQMNSSLASSKRFLVSEHDYDEIKASGTVEYLIEFRLHDLSDLGSFEAEYQAAGLPGSGPTLTWQLFRMMSAVSDGIMIAVIILVSMLVIIIALLCIRFTLLAKIEDDCREIGVMKAIGLRVSDIRSIYLAVYAALAGTGCVVGYMLSLIFRNPLLKGIRLNFGAGGNDRLAFVFGLLADLLLFFFLLFCVGRILKRFRKISPVQAVRSGTGQEAVKAAGRFRLSKNGRIPANLFLGLKDIWGRSRLYLTMLVVVILACFIMVVPQNLYHTISDSKFVTYLGVGRCDFRMDIRQEGDIYKKTGELSTYMDADPGIKKFAVFTTEVFPMNTDAGGTENIKVELGDHGVFPVQYTEGVPPSGDRDIALSVLNADELGKKVGDSMELLTGDGVKRLEVCGVYSDITNGGKTAKAAFKSGAGDAVWSTVCADVSDRGMLSDQISEYEQNFSYAKVSDIDAYISQTFGQTLLSVKSASVAAGIAAAAVTLLVTLLFMKLLTAKDRYSIGVMRSIGFTSMDITKQYAWRAVLVVIAGIILGTVLSGTLGERLAGAAISSFGAASFRFSINPLAAFVLSPLILLLTALAATAAGTGKAGEIHISESIKE